MSNSSIFFRFIFDVMALVVLDLHLTLPLLSFAGSLASPDCSDEMFLQEATGDAKGIGSYISSWFI